MADEEKKTETAALVGEPKPVEMGGGATQKAAPKKKAALKKKAVAKKAPAKKVATKKAPAKKAATKKSPAKKTPAKKSVAKEAAPAAAVVATQSEAEATPVASRPHYTPPAQSMWWQALILIAIVVYLFSFIREAADTAPTTSEQSSSESNLPAVASEQAPAAEQASELNSNAGIDPRMMMPMQPMSPMNNMGSGIGNSMADSMRDGMGFGSGSAMPPQADDSEPAGAIPTTPATATAPSAVPSTQYMPPMPPRHYSMPGYPQPPYPPRGYGFYGPNDWSSPGYTTPYPPQPMPNN